MQQNQKDSLFTKQLNEHLKVQKENIQNIEVIFNNYYASFDEFRDEKTFRKFVSPTNYSPKILLDHLSLKSAFFRHAIRLAIITIIAFFIGHIFEVQNAYWILFTIFVISRPGFAITQKRSKDRIFGTIVGAIITFLIIFIVQHYLQIEHYKIIYGIIIILCMPFAYGLLQENFSLCVVFITIYIMLGYALFTENIIEVIGYRVIDTFLGVVLSVFGNWLIFPSWEHQNFQHLTLKTLQAQLHYIKAIEIRFEDKLLNNDYKIARKNAFLSLANLSGAYQRMLQEPKSKQKNKELLNHFIVIAHDFLSILASVGVPLSSKEVYFDEFQFKNSIKNIQLNIKNSISHIDLEENSPIFSKEEEKPFINPQNLSTKEENTSTEDPQTPEEPFHYLIHLSEEMNKLVKKIKF